jgi:hypothetical protein
MVGRYKQFTIEHLRAFHLSRRHKRTVQRLILDTVRLKS